MNRTTIQRGMAICVILASVAAARGESHLMRMADIHDDQIVFTYEGDLWRATTAGGKAYRLTNDPGEEAWAKFSPDGKLIAFTAQYDGGTDVYVMPADGGVPQRLTFHPERDRVLEWFPDGKSVLFRSNREYSFRAEEIYRVYLDGGLPEKLPVDRAGLATISPDGTSIAYNRISRESSTWKRHKGGTAQNIWLGNLETGDYRLITDWVGSDNFPMWQGDAVYFNSDRAHGTLNLHRYDLTTGTVQALTDYRDYDVKYPSQGPGAIIYQYAESLHVLDLATGKSRLIPVEIPSDLVRLRPEFVEVAPTTGSFRLSPTGKRLLLEARGEILNLPVKDGEPINLTQTSGSREKNAAWSPDGRWVAFISDRTGEEEVYLVDQKGAEPWRQLTKGGLGFRMHLEWSPTSTHLLFADKFMQLNLVDVETGKIQVLDRADLDDAWERWGIQDYVWSPCGKWIAYTKMERTMYDSIFLYGLEEGKSYRLTSGLTEDWSPSFDPHGKYLYFLSNRTFEPTMGLVDQNHIFLDMARPYVLVLAADAASPFAPKDSEEPVNTQIEDEKEEDDSKKSADEATRIDLAGIERRIVVAPEVPAGNYFRLEATAKGLYYLKRNERQFTKYQTVTDETGGRLDLYHFDLDEQENKKVLSGITNYHQSPDGKHLVYRAGSTYGVVEVGKPAEVGDGKIDLAGVRIKVEREKEFAQMFDEAWRIERDWFYDPKLHALDWEAIGAKYRKFIPYCGNRSDVNYLIGEMIGELNIGHTYVRGGDVASGVRRVSTGLLGVEFVAPRGSDYYQISYIIPGTPGDPAERSPLEEPGCPLRAGTYLIAVDGQEMKTTDNPFAFLQDKGGKVVTLTFNDRPTPENAATWRVRTLGSERTLRYRAWVEQNRAYVDKLSGGRIGYLHIPDMGAGGLVEFAKSFYARYHKQGFIIDERYNGGGFTGDMIIDRLERELWSMVHPREGGNLRNPERCFAGPWAVLVNEDTGSNGEFFAVAIQLKELAPVIGMRTWGGVIGMEPHQGLMDGGSVTPPQFGLFGLDGNWIVEGHGVVPDIEVQNLPGDVIRGRDAQLEAAVENVMQRLEREAVKIPATPPFVDKSKR